MRKKAALFKREWGCLLLKTKLKRNMNDIEEEIELISEKAVEIATAHNTREEEPMLFDVISSSSDKDVFEAVIANCKYGIDYVTFPL